MEKEMIYKNNEGISSSCFFRSTVKKPNMKALLQVTERCNLKCKHCFVSSLPEGYDLSFEKIKNIILPKLIEANVTRVTLTGGEPMVHTNILDIIKLFNDNNIHITLCTNALGLNEEKIRILSKMKDIHVNVSLDGFSSKSHGKFRGNENDEVFEKIINNIKLLSQYKLLNGIMTSPNKYSSDKEYLDICKFAKKYKANYVLFNPLSKFGRGEYTQNLAYSHEDLIKLRKRIEEEQLEDKNFQIVFIRIPKDGKDKVLSDCNCEITYIFTNGDVAVCPYMVFACENEEAKYKRQDFLYGNILDNNFNLLERINKYKFPDYVENQNEIMLCKNCGKGCKAIKIAHGLSIFDCDVEMCKKINYN